MTIARNCHQQQTKVRKIITQNLQNDSLQLPFSLFIFPAPKQSTAPAKLKDNVPKTNLDYLKTYTKEKHRQNNDRDPTDITTPFQRRPTRSI